jgi:hypothetical protein
MHRAYVDSVAVRRKLAKAFRAETGNPKWSPAEQAAWARMADAWEQTISKPAERLEQDSIRTRAGS